MIYKVKNNGPLKGHVKISGAKNSALGLIAATLLSEQKIVLRNVPKVNDIENMIKAMKLIGSKINWTNDYLEIINDNIDASKIIDYDCIRKIRASYYLLGALLGKYKKAIVAIPGGCKIGTRPINLHLKGFEALGAKTRLEDGNIIVEATKLIGTKIYLDFPSVGATINIMLAAVYAKGETVISNCAKEPHIVDIANLLNEMGAKIKGAGTSTIKIIGVKELYETDYTTIPDQIEAGTFMIAAAITKGDVFIDNIIPKHLTCIGSKLTEMGVNIEYGENFVHVSMNKRLNPTYIRTSPYPGFPTDLQPQISIALGLADGPSIVEETIFESRFMYVDELSRMGSNMQVAGNINLINGIESYKGATVISPDLRAGAALVLAGLTTNKTTTIKDIELIERGYENFDEKLRNLGANIIKIN